MPQSKDKIQIPCHRLTRIQKGKFGISEDIFFTAMVFANGKKKVVQRNKAITQEIISRKKDCAIVGTVDMKLIVKLSQALIQ